MSRSKFLSSRISDIHSNQRGGPKARQSEDDDDQEARELFKRIKREAELLGFSALGEKEQKKVELRNLIHSGAKPRKGHKMPIARGLGMKRKAEERDAQQREMSIAEGITPSNKKRKRESTRDRGLTASEGVFKNGTLYVTPVKKPAKEAEEPARKYRKGKGGRGKKKKKNAKSKGKGRGKGKKF